MPLKYCTDCKTEKDSSLFSSAGQGGRLRPQCKPCTKVREKARFEARRLADGEMPATRCCSKCGEEKPLTSEFFKPGIQFKHGHTTECKKCLHARSRDWSRTDAGKALRARLAPRYKERVAQYAKAYQKANRERINSYLHSLRLRNIEQRRAVDAAWARNNKDKRAAYRHARRAAGKFDYSVVHDLKRLQSGKCAVCRGLLTRFVEVDHIFPIALGGTNERTNLQLLCRPCHRSKGAKHPVDFMQSRGLLL